MKDYTAMWKNLGLNLEAHSGLLSVLTDAYKNIYLSQKNRPKGMGYFDFVIKVYTEEHLCPYKGICGV